MYHLGTIGYGTLREDLAAWWAKVRGREDPNAKIGEKSRIGQHGEFWALRDINFEIQQGDRVGIIGRNGAGKSTLLKILSRVTAPTTGRIGIKGRVASLLEVGTGFHGELTGRENIFLNGAILGMKRREIQKKFDEIVEFAGVSEFIDTPVKRYSSGMFVRLAFAVAAHLDAEILIVDEVLAVGDAEFQKKAIGRMEEVSTGQGRTVLFVSHNMGLLRQFCNRGILLSFGKKELDDELNIVANAYNKMGLNLSDGIINLAEHPGRLKGMKKLLTELKITDKYGKVRNTFFQDEDIVIIIDYNGGAEQLAGAGFIIKTIIGFQVAGGNTYMVKHPPHRIPNKGRIKFTLEGKQFNPGLYSLTVSLGYHQGYLADKIENCGTIKVEKADIYGTGYFLTEEDGVMSLAFKGEINAL